MIRRIESTGLVAEFNINVRENLRPATILETDWENDVRRFEKVNFLMDYSTIMLPQVKDARDRTLTYLASLLKLPTTATQAGAEELTSKQHRQWIAELLNNSWTDTVKDTMDAYDEDHKGDGVVMWMCFLQEYAGSSKEAIIAAEEVMHPSKLKLDNFKHNIKEWSSYCREHFRKIQAAGDKVTSQHFINAYNALKEAHSEEFRLQILTWSRNWRAGMGEGANWTIMQLLAKVDLEYT